MIFTPKQIVVHHDGVSRKGPSFAIVNDFHRAEGFPRSSLGFFVGYHYWIERDGKTIQARDENEIGAHTQNFNYVSLGIGLAGNFDKEMPTDEQIASLGTLLSRLCFTHSIPGDQIFPHRKFNPKTCYGKLLSDTWAQEVFVKYEHDRYAQQCLDLGIATSSPITTKAMSLLAKFLAAIHYS